MKIFKINEKIEIVCEWKKTRTAFKHVATLLINGHEMDETKICYQNRTWERYEFESVLEQLVGKTTALSTEDKKVCSDYIKNYNESNGTFGMIKAMATIGGLLTKDQKSANDFKARILKAGLEKSGLIMPDDWNELSEDEKTKRLDGAIACL